MSEEDNDLDELKNSITKILANLTAREAKLLREKLGINLSSEHTMSEVDNQFEVVSERLKKIEEKALKKLARKKELEALPKCSFCKLRSDQVERLIAAPDSDAFICDGCVMECLRILQEI